MKSRINHINSSLSSLLLEFVNDIPDPSQAVRLMKPPSSLSFSLWQSGYIVGNVMVLSAQKQLLSIIDGLVVMVCFKMRHGTATMTNSFCCYSHLQRQLQP